MKKHYVIALIQAFLCFAVTSLRLAAGMPPETEARFNAVLRNWKVLAPETLRDPANANVVIELRKYALKEHTADAVVPLIDLG